MRFLSFSLNSHESFGIVQGGGVVDLGRRMGKENPTLRHVLATGSFERAKEMASNLEPDIDLEQIRFLPTIPNPEKIICIGVNYGNRDAEYKNDTKAANYPSVFMRTRETLVGHKEPIVRPPESEQLDYEGEIVLVIGKEGRRITEKHAWDYIAGLTLMNEGSVRDWLRHAKFNVTQGKNFERSGGLGPWMVTSDECDPKAKLHLKTHVNGELRQDDTTANLIYDFPYLIRYLSTFMRLKPGDIIATGTPTGAGARFDPPKYLRHGDKVEVSVPEIGRLVNRVEEEKI